MHFMSCKGAEWCSGAECYLILDIGIDLVVVLYLGL